jgi:hypothetical protein
MRSPAQTFADLLAVRDYEGAGTLLAKHGAEALQADLWLATHPWTHSAGEQKLLEIIEARPLPSHRWADAVLRRLGMIDPTTQGDPLIMWMLERADIQVLADRCVIHHAAYHGRERMLEPLKERLEAAGRWKGWDEDLPGIGTPLYLAMRECQEKAILHLLREGADDTAILQQGTPGADGKRDAVGAALQSSKLREELSQGLPVIKRKLALENVAHGAERIVEAGKRALRMM